MTTLVVKDAPRREPRNPGALYGKALDRHQRAERDLLRALRKWEKTRATLRRCEKRLDAAAMDGES